MKRVIFFDAAGTLFHLPRGPGWHYAEVARRHGSELDPGALSRAFRTAWKNAPPMPETRTPREAAERAWWKRLAGRVFSECGDSGIVDRCFDELWEEFTQPGVWELYPETHAVLTRLSQTFRLGIISNFDSRLFRILNHLGIAALFEHVIVSSVAGAEKPSPHIFHVALEKFCVPPQAALHAGDEPEADWAGARAAGLDAFELNRPDNSLVELARSICPEI